MAQFICEHCCHRNDCDDHENFTVNIEQCGDYEHCHPDCIYYTREDGCQKGGECSGVQIEHHRQSE